MNDYSFAAPFIAAPALFAAGMLLGFGYFRTMRWTVQLYETRHLAGPAVLTLMRFLGAALFLGFAARFGALPLLAAFLGFLLVRARTMQTVRSAD